MSTKYKQIYITVYLVHRNVNLFIKSETKSGKETNSTVIPEIYSSPKARINCLESHRISSYWQPVPCIMYFAPFEILNNFSSLRLRKIFRMTICIFWKLCFSKKVNKFRLQCIYLLSIKKRIF